MIFTFSVIPTGCDVFCVSPRCFTGCSICFISLLEGPIFAIHTLIPQSLSQLDSAPALWLFLYLLMLLLLRFGRSMVLVYHAIISICELSIYFSHQSDYLRNRFCISIGLSYVKIAGSIIGTLMICSLVFASPVSTVELDHMNKLIIQCLRNVSS